MRNVYFFKSTVINVISLCILSINYAEADFVINFYNKQPHQLQIVVGIDVLTPYLNDCSKFVKTDGEHSHILSCAPGTAFDIELKICDFENKVDCTDRGYPWKPPNDDEKYNIACPIGDTGFYPYPNDCSKFIECAQGQLYKKACATDTGFSKNLGVCDYKYNLPCDWNATVSQQSSILCPKDITGFFAHPFHYGKYINCTNGQTWVQNCASNYKFSISQGYCVAEAVIQNTDFVKYILRIANIVIYEYLYICPHKAPFNHIYPFDATKFVYCSNFQLTVVPCGPSEVFSITSQTCLPKHLVLNSDRVPLLSEPPNANRKIGDIIICSLDLFGLYPHPFDSAKYLKCAYGRLYSHSCMAGYLFSLSRRFCDIKKETWSFDNLPPIQQKYEKESIVEMRLNDSLTFLNCPVDLFGTFVYPFDCAKYITCNQGAMRIRSCSNDYIYGIRRKECMPANDYAKDYDHVECKTDDDGHDFSIDDFSHGVSCSPTGASKHPHPQDWHKYVQCDNGKISVEQCPRDHVFSLNSSQCAQVTDEME